MNSGKKTADGEHAKSGTMTLPEGAKSPEIIDTKKILELFESSYTEQLYDRKANYILKFCRVRRDGFFFDEIGDLTKIVEYSIKDLLDGVVPKI
jgi:hypothetical protein